MRTIGLTGGVGMGKTTAANYLAQRRLPVVDTDQLARDVVEPGKPALEEIRGRFGAEMLDSEGRLNRGELAKAVFADAEARRVVEEILHPRIRQLWLDQVSRWEEEGQEQALVVIPLLFETGAGHLFQTTICVACSEKTQHERLRLRGWSNQQINERVAAQWPVEKKMALSEFVVWSEGSIRVQERQLDKIMAEIQLQPQGE